jgi:hypothetical protein
MSLLVKKDSTTAEILPIYLLAGTPALDLQFAFTKSLTDYISGTDLVTFTRASSGTFVGSNGLLQTAATDVPRFDHNTTTGESLGLLVEEQRTNLFQRSEEFDNAYWAKGNLEGTLTANQAVAPDGATTADWYQEDTATIGRYLARSQSFTSGTTYSLSCWAKQAPGATRYLGLILTSTSFGTNAAASFTLSGAGSFTISVSGTNTSAQIQAFSNGWYRCTLISQATATSSSSVQIRLSSSASIAANSYTGDGTSGIYIWGAQLEAGAFPTSYIPTTSATVTRSADVASITGANFSSWYRQDEGTLYAEGAVPVGTSGARAIASLDNNTVDERIRIGHVGTAAMSTIIVDGGVTQFSPSAVANSFPAGEYRKLAVAFKAANFAAVTTPGTVATGSSGTVPTATQLQIGVAPSNASPNAPIKRVTFWPQRLSNSTLQAITL